MMIGLACHQLLHWRLGWWDSGDQAGVWQLRDAWWDRLLQLLERNLRLRLQPALRLLLCHALLSLLKVGDFIGKVKNQILLALLLTHLNPWWCQQTRMLPGNKLEMISCLKATLPRFNVCITVMTVVDTRWVRTERLGLVECQHVSGSSEWMMDLEFQWLSKVFQ